MATCIIEQRIAAMLTKPTLQDRLLVHLQEMEAIATEYAFDKAGLIQGDDPAPRAIYSAIMAARRIIDEAQSTVYVQQP